ncbi:unnamed protein product [Mytilus edulis]|uniref:G-protein coupled receptors family 1 profile domain-containing protein n=1 Tax=Mytilus edulis TaxID=6550 RepID=A0A8S3T8X6_MYTED|nr:unnamed protein product [Mytilus edulis]
MNKTEVSATTVTATVLFMSVSTVTLALNLLAIIILIKTKTLRKQKFTCLTLCLSLGNIIASATGIFTGIIILLQFRNIHIPYICLVVIPFLSAAHIFSLVQVLFICIERFLATRSTRQTKTWSKRHTISYIASFSLITAYSGLIGGLYGNPNSTTCQLDILFTDNFWIHQLSLSTCRLCLYVLIVNFYGMVFFRLKKRMTVVYHEDTSSKTAQSGSHSDQHLPGSSYGHDDSEGKSSCPCEQSKKSWKQRKATTLNRHPDLTDHTDQFRRSINTLGIIIIVVTVSVLPSVILNIVSASNANIDLTKLTQFSNILALVNPLAEPFLYVLRLREYRKAIVCKC